MSRYDVEAKNAAEMVTQRCIDAGREISLLCEVGGFSGGVVGRSEGREGEGLSKKDGEKKFGLAQVYFYGLKLKGKTRE